MWVLTPIAVSTTTVHDDNRDAVGRGVGLRAGLPGLAELLMQQGVVVSG